MRKYTKEENKELLKFFKRNNIILVNKESIGEVDLSGCLVYEGWIIDELSDDKNDRKRI